MSAGEVDVVKIRPLLAGFFALMAIMLLVGYYFDLSGPPIMYLSFFAVTTICSAVAWHDSEMRFVTGGLIVKSRSIFRRPLSVEIDKNRIRSVSIQYTKYSALSGTLAFSEVDAGGEVRLLGRVMDISNALYLRVLKHCKAVGVTLTNELVDETD